MLRKLKFLTTVSNKATATIYMYNAEFRILFPIETIKTLPNCEKNIFCIEIISNILTEVTIEYKNTLIKKKYYVSKIAPMLKQEVWIEEKLLFEEGLLVTQELIEKSLNIA